MKYDKLIVQIFIVLLVMSLSLVSFAANEAINVQLNNNALDFTEDSGSPFIIDGRTLVPLRITTESINATVDWDAENREAIVKKEGVTLRVPIGQAYIFKNDRKIENDAKAIIKDGRTYLPIRVVMESLNYNVGWDNDSRSVLLNRRQTERKVAGGLKQINYQYNDEIAVNGVIIDADSDLEIKTALAKEQVGATETLKTIAENNNAKVAINGSYFSAYDENDIKDPYGVLVVDGKMVHNANDRAVIGVNDGAVDIDRIDTKIKGDNGDPDWKYSWNGYWINHSVYEDGVSLTVYTPERGDMTHAAYGTNYIVEDGEIVEKVKNQSVAIPNNGLVINLNGQLGATSTTVYDRFKVGYPCDYKTILEPQNGGDADFWNNLDYAVGAGPALIIDGQINIDYIGEQFAEKKITEMSHARSAIGYKENGDLVLITTTATMDELANIMEDLGCYEAMNLDGGASSGLFYQGDYIREPGREISNILYIQ
jgi:exopolysaccharide biosynthesis protein